MAVSEGDRFFTVGGVGRAVTFIVVESLLNQGRVRAFDNAAIIDQAAETSDGVSAAAETEEIELIAGAVVLDNIAVVVHDIFMEAEAGGPADYGVVVGTDAPVVKNLLRDIIVTMRTNGPGQAQDISGEILSPVFLRPIPGAIGTDDDFFHSEFPGLNSK